PHLLLRPLRRPRRHGPRRPGLRPGHRQGGWPAPIDYLTVPDTGDQQVAEIWQQQLARVGLRVDDQSPPRCATSAEGHRVKSVTCDSGRCTLTFTMSATSATTIVLR